MSRNNFAPPDLFEQILEYMAIPTFDLILEHADGGVVLVKRKIEPYKNVWALPGLRMYKGESIDDTLERIATSEVGLSIDPGKKRLLGQYVGKFSTQQKRQDISTCYVVPTTGEIKLNNEHFREFMITKTIPQPIGAMYKYYLNMYYSGEVGFAA